MLRNTTFRKAQEPRMKLKIVDITYPPKLGMFCVYDDTQENASFRVL